MKRLVALAAALMMLCMTASATVVGAPEVSAPSVLLMEKSSGQVLFELNAHERLPPASVTKVMTLLLIMEAIDSGRVSLTDTVTASAYAASMGGSQIYLEENEQLSLEEMLKSVVVSSANDCAVALAEYVAGSETAFVAMMNARAAELGMADTNFVNCTGLDNADVAGEHLTSAHDIAVMSRELLSHEKIKDYTTVWMDTVRGGQFGLSNTNKLIRFYNGATGLKTGFTGKARHCISATAKRDGMELIAVVLSAPSSAERFESARSMLDFGFANYAVAKLTDEAAPSVPVVLGCQESVPGRLSGSGELLVEKQQLSSITREYVMSADAEAPVEEGQLLGELIVSADGVQLASIPVEAAVSVERLSWGELVLEYFAAVFMAKRG